MDQRERNECDSEIDPRLEWLYEQIAQLSELDRSDTVFTDLIPALRAERLTQAEIEMLMVINPANAFAISVR